MVFFKDDRGEEAATLIKKMDFKNPFHNNLAQAVEVFTELTKGLELIDALLSDGLDPSVAAPSARPPLKGIGTVEAPRGGLYNEVHITKNHTIKYANIITPTVQNLTSIEETAAALLEKNSKKSKKEVTRLLEMLVRAYDPCITCSTH